MSSKPHPKNIAASIRARLLDVSRRKNVDFQLVLSEFAIERLLYRIGVSAHADRFVLKGAMLLKLWAEGRYRATWDLDLLGRGASAVPEVEASIRDLCAIHAEDGIIFQPESIAAEPIRATDEYAGVRVRLEARLAEARIPVQVDVGFGDAIVPAPRRQSYPTLLDHPAPRILVYSRDAVVAEKLEAMVSLGVTNSRMKDFYDVHLLASFFEFDGATLTQAVRTTFERRRIPIPKVEPIVLSREFLTAPYQQILWRAFLRRARLDAPLDAGEISDALRRFLSPILGAAACGEILSGKWPPGGPWKAAT